MSRNYKDRTDIPGTNNSTAVINPTDNECKIKAAYLFWQSRSEDAPATPIGMISPTGKIKTYMADPSRICKDIRFNGEGEEYTAIYTMVAEVTDFVCSDENGYGAYTVANIPVWDGVQTGEVTCGGESVASWQLIVVEESPDFPLRTISLNMLSQYFFNINYRVGVDFADVSAPNGDISLQWYNLFTDVDSQYRLSGAVKWGEEYWDDESNYRYKTPTRGLYKNGISFNNRDTGSLYATGVGANGAIHGHLYKESRDANNFSSTGIVYLQEGKNRGICVTTLGVAIDVFAYDIVFDGNGADSGNMDNMVCVYGRDYTLPSNKYSKQHWKFTGWSTESDGSGMIYVNKASVSNLCSTQGGSVTLYAQWTSNTYTIHFDANGGIGTMNDMKCEFNVEYKLNANQFTKNGYGYAGWSLIPDGSLDYTDEAIVNNLLITTGTVNLYAVWIPIYEITLDHQGADTMGTQQYFEKYNAGIYADEACITAITTITIPMRTGYNFEGYFTETNGKGMKYVDVDGRILSTSTTFIQDTTLYAYWTPISYMIRFEGNGSTDGSMKDMVCSYDKSYQLDVNQFTRTNYTYLGWNTDVNGNGTSYADQSAVKNITSVHGAVVTLYAQWKPNTYEVCFDANNEIFIYL